MILRIYNYILIVDMNRFIRILNTITIILYIHNDNFTVAST